jgi:hypothetical protein
MNIIKYTVPNTYKLTDEGTDSSRERLFIGEVWGFGRD